MAMGTIYYITKEKGNFQSQRSPLLTCKTHLSFCNRFLLIVLVILLFLCILVLGFDSVPWDMEQTVADKTMVIFFI